MLPKKDVYQKLAAIQHKVTVKKSACVAALALPATTLEGPKAFFEQWRMQDSTTSRSYTLNNLCGE